MGIIKAPEGAPTAAGGLVYSHDAAGQRWVLLIRDKHNNWGLPKGHLHTDEPSPVAAHREIEEETGINSTIGPLIGRISYTVSRRNKYPRPKTVDYFLAYAPYDVPVPAAEEGITEVRWVTPSTALSLVPFHQVRDIIRRGLRMIDASSDGQAPEAGAAR